jgi:hypothetical protein
MDFQIHELSRTIISRIAQNDIHSDASNHIENIPTTPKEVMIFSRTNPRQVYCSENTT